MSAPPATALAEAPLDESLASEGDVRSAYRSFFDRFPAAALAEEKERIAAELGKRGVTFAGDPERPFDVDPIPRLIGAGEWERLGRGLAQRVRALNEFLADVYGPRRAVAAGVLPERVIEEADSYDPAMAGPTAPPVRAQLAGIDLVRDPGGELLVLEDNLRAPSGVAYLLAARDALEPLAARTGIQPRGLQEAVAALARAVRGAAPEPLDGGDGSDSDDPAAVLLVDGPDASAAFEHRELAEMLGMEIATAAELRRSGDRLLLAGGPGAGDGRSVGLVYRRVDDERLTAADGDLTELGELLVQPLLAGRVECVNSPGSGIADDKAVHVYAERLIDFYLGEEPLLRSVPGYDLGDAEQRARALPRIEAGELVVKPRAAFGGEGIVIGPRQSASERARTAARVREQPQAFVAQEPVALSVHPTLVEGPEIASRHVDLRPFVISEPERVTVLPGGLTRFARAPGEMVVNSGQGGGAKDTWVV